MASIHVKPEPLWMQRKRKNLPEATIDDLPHETRMRVVRDSEGCCMYCAQLEGERHRKDCRYRRVDGEKE